MLSRLRTARRWRPALIAVAIFVTMLPGYRTTAVPGDFAAVVPRLAYSLLPWTPLLPFVFVRPRRVTWVRVALVVAVVLGLLVESRSPIVARLALAAALGATLEDLAATKRPLVLLALAVGGLGFLLARDLSFEPDRMLDAIEPGLPHGHSVETARAVRIGTTVTSALVAVALLLPRSLPLAVAGGALAGLFLRVHTYPIVLARVSPRAALEAFDSHQRTGDTLAGLGIDAGTSLRDPEAAARWLDDGDDDHRRFVALSATNLPRVNAAYRARHHTNLPILSGKDGAYLLGVNRLDGETDENPLTAILPAAPPAALNPPTAKLESAEMLGWDQPPGHLRVALRVNQPMRGFCTFLHIDGASTRFNAEHKEDRLVPMALWQPGDIVIDDFAVEKPRDFPSGKHPAYWGIGILPCQDDHRMHVTEGPSDGRDRIRLGDVEVK
jgi:hypothetical protein